VARRLLLGIGAGSLLVIALSSWAAGGAAWLRFRSPDGRFAVDLPAAPTQQLSEQQTLVGRVRTRVFVAARGDTELRVEVHEVPGAARWLLTDGALLARAERDLLEDEGALDVRASDVQQLGRPAREVTYRDAAGRLGRARLVLLEGRLYVLATLRPLGAESSAVERFLDSFEAW